MKLYLKISIAIILNHFCTTSSAQWVKLNTDSIHIYTGIYFLNKDTGFVCGWLNQSPHNTIVLTYDGGTNWDTISFGWIFPTDIQFVNDSTGFIGGQDGAFYKTTDQGNTWNAIGYCIWLDDISNFHFFNENSGICLNFYGSIKLIDPNLSPLICISNFNSTATTYFPGTGELGFLNNLEGYAAGGNGKFLKTFDGGSTWNYFNADSSMYIFGAKMSDQNHAVIVGNNGNYSISNDGGINWTLPVSMSQNHHHILDVDFYNNQYGFAVGGYNTFGYPSAGPYPIGSIWSTSDCGNTWVLVDSSYNDQLTDIHIVNDSLAFAVGLSGLVLRNTNHFSTINSVNENPVPAINIYPNPFSEEINITFPSDKSYSEIFLYDIQGKQVFCKMYSGNNLKIKSDQLKQGVYFLKILNGDHIINRKIIKID